MTKPRADVPRAAPELETLGAFLDFLRSAMIRKTEGLSDELLRKRLVPSETTLLGLIKHLANVEHGWFQVTFAGREDAAFPFSWTDDDPDADFRAEADESTAEIIATYRRKCDDSRAAIAGASPDDHARRADRSDYTLRWIMIHMIEETARHAGHADILREQLDGSTGE